ncbi:MAG: molybdenum cofactor guanylyltransferase [Gammaproteobacteria bacterium]|nr:MAG: molybdenum cofactor guanylyltransferase [Gammaproteobacteria bacterium]
MDIPPTIGLILAGGRSRRMGTDKALVTLAGRSLAAHVIERLAPQVDEVVISSNAPRVDFGVSVLPDVLGGYCGPLAGVHAALARFPDAAVVSVAVDLPLLPRDLVARLKTGWDGVRCRYAVCGDRHALAILWPPAFANSLWNYLTQGRRSVSDWLEHHGEPVPVPSDGDADLRLNINTPADLARAVGLVAHRGR